ncbi:MAG: hypothetical protein ABL921_02495 [Pirellula sp.]
MNKKLANWTRLAVVVAVVAGTQTGCKSGWKMPGSDLFSWSKKPSESTLAGSSPSLAMPSSSTSPTSPASKNMAMAINTPGQKSTSPYGGANPYGAPNPYGSANPYSSTNSSGPGFSMPTGGSVAMGGAGSAAAQNGYSNGPYGMVSNASRPTGYTAPSGYGAPATALANNVPGLKPPPTGYSGTNALAGTSTMPSMPSGYPQLPTNNSVPAIPAGYSGGPTMAQSLPPAQSSMPNAAPSGYQPTMPSVATQTYNGVTPYRPGSVGRTTGYDFSNQGAGTMANGTAPTSTSTGTSTGYGLPPAVPNTANGYTNQTFR